MQKKKIKDIKERIGPVRRKTADDHTPEHWSIKKAMHNLNLSMGALEQRTSIPFEKFLNELVADPPTVIRNVFQIFHDMIKAYVGEGIEEYPDDPESIHYA